LVDLADERMLGTGLSGTAPAETYFRDFVAARSAALFGGALVLTRNRETAEDLVQETLERAWSKWSTVAAKDAPEAYVRRIMVNLANDRWRKFRRTVAHQGDSGGVAPGDEYARVDSRDQLVRALHSLPMRMRTVVVLRYFHNLSDVHRHAHRPPPHPADGHSRRHRFLHPGRRRYRLGRRRQPHGQRGPA
jgi:RNA polymerase sigma factor (sigma-70 family)